MSRMSPQPTTTSVRNNNKNKNRPCFSNRLQPAVPRTAHFCLGRARVGGRAKKSELGARAARVRTEHGAAGCAPRARERPGPLGFNLGLGCLGLCLCLCGLHLTCGSDQVRGVPVLKPKGAATATEAEHYEGVGPFGFGPPNVTCNAAKRHPRCGVHTSIPKYRSFEDAAPAQDLNT
jgi:hypothetical protein